MKDIIERQAALDVLAKIFPVARCNEYTEGITTGAALAIEYIKQLPSAQPEQLTFKEQCIFLKAMAREEKVCEEVDRNNVFNDNPFGDSLVRVCKEIRRKVKGALWT